MGVMVYKEGQSAQRIEPWEMEGYFSMGWVLDKSGKPAPKAEDQAKPDLDLEQARLAYEHMFGKKPHHKMKLDTILEEMNGNQPV